MEVVAGWSAVVVTLVASVRVNGSGRPPGERTAEVDVDGQGDVTVVKTVAGVNAGIVVVDVVNGFVVVNKVVINVVVLVSSPRVVVLCLSNSSCNFLTRTCLR